MQGTVVCANVPMQSVHIINNVLSLNPAHDKAYSMQHYIIEILLKVAGVKHHNPTPLPYMVHVLLSFATVLVFAYIVH